MAFDPEVFKKRDAASYDSVAEQFHYWTERVTAPIAKRFVEIANVRAEDRVLDVGTGSGVVVVAMAQQAEPPRQVLGTDLSEGMLERARRRAGSLGIRSNVEFRNMDAERLELPSESFDVATSLFSLLHFPDRATALRELFRVLRPGGRVATGVGAGIPFSFSQAALFFGQALDRFRAAQGRLLAAPTSLACYIDQRLPEVESETHCHVNEPLDQSLREIGFLQLKRYWIGYRHRIDSSAEFWDLQTTFSSIVRKRLQAAPKERVEALRAGYLRKCDAVLARGGELVYRNGAYVVVAVRPFVPAS